APGNIANAPGALGVNTLAPQSTEDTGTTQASGVTGRTYNAQKTQTAKPVRVERVEMPQVKLQESAKVVVIDMSIPGAERIVNHYKVMTGIRVISIGKEETSPKAEDVLSKMTPSERESARCLVFLSGRAGMKDLAAGLLTGVGNNTTIKICFVSADNSLTVKEEVLDRLTPEGRSRVLEYAKKGKPISIEVVKDEEMESQIDKEMVSELEANLAY
ncbi:MAG: hypothetical protein NTZ95_03255, partial [Candidatus Omnitrophica bacterium]|nr:hypothetical protein [Candidatus Omnitrophota bacterium]